MALARVLSLGFLALAAQGNPSPYLLGGYAPVNNVLEQSQIVYDIKIMTNTAHEKDFDIAKDIYVNGGYSCAGNAPITLQSFVQLSAGQASVGHAFFDSFTNGTDIDRGPSSLGIPGVGRLNLALDFWDTFIVGALEGTGDFANQSLTSRMVAVQKGILGVVTMHVANLLDEAVAQAASGKTADDEAAKLWDRAWGFYYGACGDAQCPVHCVTPGWCRFSAWEATMKRDIDYAYNSGDRVPGALEANAAVTNYFRQGLRASRGVDFNLSEMIEARNNIFRIFCLSAIRAVLRYAYAMNRGNAAKYPSLNELVHMQAFAYFQAAAGWIEQAAPGVGQYVLDKIDFRQSTSTVSLDIFCDIQARLIPAYASLGLDCTRIGMDKHIPSSFTCPNLPACPSNVPDLPAGLSEYSLANVTATENASNLDCTSNLLVNFDTSTTTSTLPPRNGSYEGVDSGEGRACRGSYQDDNLASYYEIMTATSLENCKLICQQEARCVGIEFHFSSGRCEVWTRLEGIEASVPSAGYQCFRFLPADRTIPTSSSSSSSSSFLSLSSSPSSSSSSSSSSSPSSTTFWGTSSSASSATSTSSVRGYEFWISATSTSISYPLAVLSLLLLSMPGIEAQQL